MLAQLLGPHEWLGWTAVIAVALVVVTLVRRPLIIVGMLLSIGLLVLSNEGVIPTLPGM